MFPFFMLFLFPYRNDKRCTRFPIVTTILIALNVLAYLVVLWLRAANHGDVAAALVYAPGRTGWDAMLTSIFVHASLFHLLLNLWVLGLIGGQVEEEMGRRWFLLFYLAGGFSANLSHAFYCRFMGLTGDQALGVVGASSAIYAVMGAYLVLFPFEEFRFWYFVARRWGTVKVATLFFVPYKLLGDVTLAWTPIVRQWIMRTAYWSCLGGFAFGVVIALIAFGGGAFIGKERLSREERERQRRFRHLSRRKLYSDAPLPTPMTEAELATATEDMTPAEGIRRGLFFHNGRMLEWAYQEMLFENPKACLDAETQFKLIEMLIVHGRDSLAEVAAWNLIETHPNSPEAIQTRLDLGRMLARLPEMRKEAARLLREFLAAEPALRDRTEAERLLRRLDDRPLWQWK